MPMNVEVDMKTLRANVTLPSRGLAYKDKLPGGQITVKSMTTEEEKILAGQAGEGDAKLSQILANCIDLKGLSINDMLLSDKFYMLMVLKVVSYGPTYELQMTCAREGCGCEYKHVVDVTQLPVRAWDKYEEPFSVTLPFKGNKLSLRFLRGFDENEIRDAVSIAFKKKAGLGDPAYIPRLAKFVTAIDGKDVTWDEAKAFMVGLPARDSQALRRTIEKADCGVDTTLNVQCPKCSTKDQVSLPFTADFFKTPEES